MMPQMCVKKGKAGGLKKLIHQTQSSDEDEYMRDSTPQVLPNATKAWRADFTNYIDTVEAKLLPGMSTIQWWGVCTDFYLDCLSFAHPSF